MQAEKEFQQAILWVKYDGPRDEIMLGTPWGAFIIKREAVPELRDVPREMLARIETSQTAIHIEELDLDINSAGLLASLFLEIEGQLTY